MQRIGWVLIAAFAAMMGNASAQSGDNAPPVPGADATMQPSPQGVSPREAWRRYMQAVPRVAGPGAREGQAPGEDRGGMRASRQGPGMMSGAAQRPSGTTFYFNPRQGSVYIRCAPNEPAEACAKAFAPIIDMLTRQNAGGGANAGH